MSRMKKLVYLIMFMTLFSCTTTKFMMIDKKEYVGFSKILKNKEKLQFGDIIIFRPNGNLEEAKFPNYGHAMIVGEDNKLLDFPWIMPYQGVHEIPIEFLERKISWNNRSFTRKVIVLRYKYMNKAYAERLKKYLYNSENINYDIVASMFKVSRKTYCTKFIKDAYESANLTNETLFPEQNAFVYPSDFLTAGKNFYIVNFK